MMTTDSTDARGATIRKLVLALLRASPDDSVEAGRAALLQGHLAEYQAITLRNTYWLTLQYALFPILGAGLAVLAQMWDHFDKNPAIFTQAHRITVWLAVTIINVVIIAHTEVGWESYNNVVYLENHLRPKITKLLRDMDILGYESYLREQRGRGPKWWEIPGPIVSFALLLGGLALFGFVYPLSPVEWAALPVNFFLAIMIAKVTFKMVRRRGVIGNLESETSDVHP
jgi:hypothetical protein